MNKIPMENYYYLILYTFDLIKDKNLLSQITLEKESSFSDVLIALFIKELEKIIKKGIYQNYNLIEEEINLIKGKVNLKKYFTTPTKKLECSYDEFNSDNLSNQIIKHTINKLLLSKDLNDPSKKKLRINYTYFHEVSLIEIDINDINSITLNKQNQHYLLILKLCLFINKNLIPHSTKGRYNFVDVFQMEKIMHSIYEKFLNNFYDIHLGEDYKIWGSQSFNWDLVKIEGTNEYRIPTMNTDLEITNKKTKEHIVIDAKYYTNAFSSRYESKTMLSNNMYQINTYLMHRKKEYEKLRGILLYPTNGFNISEKYQMPNQYTIEFSTINLNQDWKLIENDLISIIVNN